MVKPSTDDVLKWAREAGFLTLGSSYNMVAAAFTHAYAAGAAAMKERAAKVCEGENDSSKQEFDPEILLWNTAIRLCAMKIRELGGDDETNN